MTRDLYYVSGEEDKIHMPREAYLGEGCDDEGRPVHRFAVPHISDVPDSQGGFYVEFPRESCHKDYVDDVVIDAPFDEPCVCRSADTLTLHYKGQCAEFHLRNWEIEWACRKFSAARFADAKRSVVSRRHEISGVCIKKSDIEREDDRFFETKPYEYKGKDYTLKFDKRDCYINDSQGFIDCRLPGKTAMFDGLRAKDVKAMVEGRERAFYMAK